VTTASNPKKPARRTSAAPPADLAVPRLVRLALWPCAVGGLLIAVQSVLIFLARGTIADKVVATSAAKGTTVTREAAISGLTPLLLAIILVSVAVGALFVLLALRARTGRSDARTGLIVATALALLFETFLIGEILGMVGVFGGTVAITMLFAPTARDFFAAAKKARATS
jgi:hypothetical protein